MFVLHLFTVWADRITTRASTAFTPYRLVFGQDCVLPVELTAVSWATVSWNRVRSREDLLAARARQLERRDDDLEKAKENVRESRGKNKRFFDIKRRERREGLEIGDMVLLYNSTLDKQWSQEGKE